MPKNTYKWVDNVELEKEEEVPYNKPTQETFVAIRSRVDARVKVTGAVTGKAYEFPSAGSVVNVDTRDKDEILNKKRGRACCGGTTNASLFELV
jgi:hypothetical protein